MQYPCNIISREGVNYILNSRYHMAIIYGYMDDNFLITFYLPYLADRSGRIFPGDFLMTVTKLKLTKK